MDTNYLELTENDKMILDSYNIFVNNLGNYLGEGYEIILHSLENLDASVINIYNGHYSNRKIGSPITNFALSMLAKINNNKHHEMVSYFNTSKSGAKMKSCTIPIEGENKRIIGLFCMNFYLDTSLENIFQSMFSFHNDDVQEDAIQETFTENIDDLISDSLKIAVASVQNDDNISLQNKNKEIIKALYGQGIFNLKDSVVKVAELLEISKNTVYMHLRSFK